jgi:hypothetical protein
VSDTEEEILADTRRIRERMHELMQPLQVIVGRIDMIQRQLGLLAEDLPAQGPTVRAVLRLPTQPTELGVGLALLMMGLLLLAPGDTLGSAPGYSGLRFLSETIWGFGLAVIGAGQIGGVFLAGRAMRRYLAFFALIVWIVLAGLFLRGNPLGLGWVLAVAPMIGTAWVLLRGPS